MSLTRLALRLAAVAALSDATIAGARVFDSRIDDLEEVAKEGIAPVVVVYTDADSGTGAAQSLRTRERTVTLTIDLAMMVRGEAEQDEVTLGVPATDAELELMLDVLEMQVIDALFGTSTAADLFKTIATGVNSVSSQRGATKDGGHKLAGRSVVLELSTLADWPAGQEPPAYIEALLSLLEADPARAPLRPLLANAFSRGAPDEFAKQIARALDLSAKHREALALPPFAAPSLPQHPALTLNGERLAQ